MIDVHPPHKPTHTWTDFFIHIATICVGLIIAIGLEFAANCGMSEGKMTLSAVTDEAARKVGNAFVSSADTWCLCMCGIGLNSKASTVRPSVVFQLIFILVPVFFVMTMERALKRGMLTAGNSSRVRMNLASGSVARPSKEAKQKPNRDRRREGYGAVALSREQNRQTQASRPF